MEHLACSETKIESSSEESLVRMGGVINKQEPTTDSSLGLVVDYLSKLPQSVLISVASLMVLLVGILNHMAGPEISSTIFYLIPIVLVTWFTRRSIGFAFSILSAFTWLIADLTSGATHFNPDIPYWNGVARLSSFFILTFILSTLKKHLKARKGIFQNRFFDRHSKPKVLYELVNMEINRARRYEHAFTVVCIDLDNFKTVNDCFGHSTGDILLRLVARTLQKNIRATDTVARLGGDEFAILLPETGRNVAEVILQKVQKINLEIMRRHGWPVTLSIGVVTSPSPPSTVDETLRISDQLMYTAKNGGKNSIQYEVFGKREGPVMRAV